MSQSALRTSKSIMSSAFWFPLLFASLTGRSGHGSLDTRLPTPTIIPSAF